MDHPAEFLKTHLKFSPKWRWVLMVHLDADASSSVQNDKWQKWLFKIKILFSNLKFYFFAYTFFCIQNIWCPTGISGVSHDNYGSLHTLILSPLPTVQLRPLRRISLPAKTLRQPCEALVGAWHSLKLELRAYFPSRRTCATRDRGWVMRHVLIYDASFVPFWHHLTYRPHKQTLERK